MPIGKLSIQKLERISTNLNYLKMDELKELCAYYHLPITGKKTTLIQRLLTFVSTGKIEPSKKLPIISQAKKGQEYPLHPKTKILHGAYKNDLKTRLFFKNLIGDHFHFTAYGLDWIQSKWQSGNPPTYAQFAKFWQQEHKQRIVKKPPPKPEWAFINFWKKFRPANPKASCQQIVQAWDKLRLQKYSEVKADLKTLPIPKTKF